MPEQLKHELKNEQGQDLKLYTILIGNQNGFFAFIHDVHSVIAYDNFGAIEEARRNYSGSNIDGVASVTGTTTPNTFTYEIKKITPLADFLKFISDNVNLPIDPNRPVMVQPTKYVPIRLPYYTDKTKARDFVEKLITAVPAIVEDETDQRILSRGLSVIKKLYGEVKDRSFKVSRSNSK